MNPCAGHDNRTTPAAFVGACAAILAPKFGIAGIAFSCAIGWSLMLLFEVPYYVVTCKKKQLVRKKSSLEG